MKLRNKKIVLIVLILPLAWASYINFMYYNLSNLFGEPVEYWPLFAMIVGVAGYIMLAKAHTKHLRMLGAAGVTISIGNVLFYLVRAYIGVY